MQYNACQTARIESFARRVLSVRNSGVLPVVTPELNVSLNVPAFEDLCLPADYAPWGAGENVAAGGAATYAGVQVTNRTTDQLIVLQLTGGGSVAQWMYWLTLGAGLGAGGPPAATTAAWRDTRRTALSFPLNSSGIEIVQGVTAVVPPTNNFTVWMERCAAEVMVKGPWIVLGPGGNHCLITRNANTGLYWSAIGYVRNATPDELTGL